MADSTVYVDSPSQSDPSEPEGDSDDMGVIGTIQADVNYDPEKDGEKAADCEEEGQKESPKKRKRRKTRAAVWKHFKEGPEDEDGSFYATCIYCGTKYKQGQQRGTSSMRNHIDKGCKQFPKNLRPAMQKLLQAGKTEEGQKVVAWVFDQMKCRQGLAKMAIAHEYPFNIVNHYYFREFLNDLQPLFKIPSRNTLRADCIKFYEEEYANLYKHLGQLKCRMSFTSDLWTNKGRDRGFMAITCHYIDDGWRLRKRIITFIPLPSPHTGKHIAEAFYDRLVMWNLDKKAFCLVLDNASSNDACINELFESTPMVDDLPVGGKLFHQRCGCHILNLIVHDGLDVLEKEIDKIRDTMKYIRHSQSRIEKFKLACSQAPVPYKRPAWDVPTRWNSTYTMLQLALELKPAIIRYGNIDKNYKYCPEDFPWDAVQVVVGHLKVFYDATMKLSGTKYPTLNLFFSEFSEVYLNIRRMSRSDYTFIVEMGQDMLVKFNKYWTMGNSLLAIGCVLDPRCKMHVVEYYMKEMSPGDVDRFIDNLKNCMKELLKGYVQANANDPSEKQARKSKRQKTSTSASTGITDTRAGLKDFMKGKKGSEPPKSELDDYLGDSIEEASLDEEFDILAWWKIKSAKYPVLSQMARDILAVPISTVASESAFSNSGRVLNPVRSSLSDESIEALLCTQDWLRASINGMKLFLYCLLY
ncbi:hypothetical protein LUZ61_014908 [Rhynchospora tenuis]|uniref:BED-type domain-containing protein n=1 Tax=Rhynchospora tenuis TaxID=198213 RepID=A0AAD5WC61_9POAL|nr:hypothetical protein LUZ61_014908 [Rhynchospora tenuis]